MTLPPLILIHQCMFYTECSFPWGYVRDFPIPWTIGCIWILPLKQHCGWNLISWSDTAKCLSAVAHKFLNNMKGILEVPNKRAITNTKHSYDIYFQKRECNLSSCKIFASSQNVEELLFKVRIINNTRSASNFNISVFWIKAQGKEPFFTCNPKLVSASMHHNSISGSHSKTWRKQVGWIVCPLSWIYNRPRPCQCNFITGFQLISHIVLNIFSV